MPTYEYACTACGERTEAKQGFDDPPLEECLQCGGRLRKMYSPVGIVFKGSGFYSTDRKKTSKSGAKASDGDTSEKKSDSKKETKSESKETKPAKSKKSAK
ncbi:MAG: FmdB family transcriptional regulator [Actinomycetota bacterium]|nr:FmdB family transcriptional regulator [Actinomycetota bacterium]